MKKVTLVFWLALAAALLFVLRGVISPEHLDRIMVVLQQFFLVNFS